MLSFKHYFADVDSFQLRIVNANQEKVLFALDRLLRDERSGGSCGCAKCISDAAALALNCLPPHYFVDPGRGGEIGSPVVMVESAVKEALEIVKKNPRHQ